MQATPATWRMLLEAGWNGAAQLKMLCGGEALPRDLADALLARRRRVWNMYGPTETTIWSATSRVEPGPGRSPSAGRSPTRRSTSSTGRAAGSRSAWPASCTSAATASPRLLKRPELTAEKFIPEPVPTTTADAGCTAPAIWSAICPDGRLEFLGRLDSQVKVRGFRIETSEVESVISNSPGVRECVVVAREDAPGDKRLVAYLVATPTGRSPAAGDLRRSCRPKLPEYMVPTVFVALDALPRTPNGKVDRQTLPRAGRGAANGRDPVTTRCAASSPRERAARGHLREVLHLDRVSVDDSFSTWGRIRFMCSRSWPGRTTPA